ncbi:FAD-dependent oxidoreductase [Nocardioides sp.]|uniref:FAD-dependent oxidoreductase n=1 Tax=Nocardioides sp. TaxID=35761 RepID=UPI0031FE6CA4|nr:dependent oxidoreductase [Nocardioides sp.]
MALISLWQDRHPRTPQTNPEVGGRWDVVVVGGGLTGLTTALLLGRAGKSVLLLEADHIGVGTTGRSTAKISLLQGTQLSTITRKHSSSVAATYVEANREGQAWVERFCGEHEVPLQRRSAYTYAHGERGARRARAELEAARAAGLAVEWVDEVPLPFDTSGAVRLEDQLQVDPIELLDALSLEAAAHGVTIVERARVRQVTGRDPVRVHTEQGDAEADVVVVATNIPFLDRGAFFARMAPGRSYGLAFRTETRGVDGMYLSADSPSRSLRDAPAIDGHVLLVGGNGHTTGRTSSPLAKIDDLRRWTATHWPEAVETHAWSAQDYLPHHSLPYAGPVLPGATDILVAGGFSKWGMTNGVAAALALSGQILGGHQEWAQVMRTWAPQEVRGLASAALMNAEVGLEMTAGWLRPLTSPGMGAAPGEGDADVRFDKIGRGPTASSRVGGTERRVSAVCSHLGGIVAWNDAERSWDCPLHGSRFAPSGEVLEGPATCGLKPH